MKTLHLTPPIAATARVLLVLLASVSAAFAADEFCAKCGGRVAISGDFTHRKDPPFIAIEGAGTGAEAAPFHEDVNGPRSPVPVPNPPAGKYAIEITAAETTATAAGERVFDVTAGDVVLAKDFDLFASAGGARKIAT